MKTPSRVYGVGINDIAGSTGQHTGGIAKRDPVYVKWSDMLMRCYSAKYQVKYPTYVGCTVTPEWHRLSGFKAWMLAQHWADLALDKDIIQPGNKIYGPAACAFVPRWLNNFLNQNSAQRGEYPLGVTRSLSGRFTATIESGGRSRTVGTFGNIAEAESAYLQAKREEAIDRITRYGQTPGVDLRVLQALRKRYAL